MKISPLFPVSIDHLSVDRQQTGAERRGRDGFF
jgi:hypothetical protein